MTDSTMTSSAPSDAPALPGLFARAIGVITSPGETFRHVTRTPKVAGMLFLVCAAAALTQGLPQFTERGRAMVLEMQVEQTERFTGQPVTDETYEVLRQRGQFGAYMALLGSFIFVPFVSVVMTAILWAAFNTIMGGTATFKHVMAVVVHSQIIGSVGGLISAPVMYMRGQMSTSVANLGALAASLDEGSYLARVLGMIDLFAVWWIVVLAIGLATLYKRTVSGVTTGLLITYLVIVLGFASIFGG